MKASSVRRRSKAQILQDKQAALQKEQEIKEKLAAWDELEAELEDANARKKDLEAKLDSFKDVYYAGQIKKGEDGQYKVLQDPGEVAKLEAKRSKNKPKKAMSPLDAEHFGAQLSNMDESVQQVDLLDDECGME